MIRSILFIKFLPTAGSGRMSSAAFTGSGWGSEGMGTGMKNENMGGGWPKVIQGGTGAPIMGGCGWLPGG